MEILDWVEILKKYWKIFADEAEKVENVGEATSAK
jgi:hypothetical protein